MFLAGSNNCYEVGSNGRCGRRTRSWEPFRFYNRRDKLSEDPEVILKALDADLSRVIRKHRGEKEAKPADIRNRWGYYVAIAVGGGHCADTSWNKWRSQFTNGIKNALTIEELDNIGVNLVFMTFSPNGNPPIISLKTEKQYFAELKKWREWKASNTDYHFYLTFSPFSTDVVLKRLRRSHRRQTPVAEKTRVVQDHYFVLSNSNGNLLKYTRRGYRYSYSPTGGKQFRTEKEADSYRKCLIRKQRHEAGTWKVKRIDHPTSFLVVCAS